MREKGYICIPTFFCENGRYPGPITGNSMITCNENIKTIKIILTKTVPVKSTTTNFNEKNVICRMKHFYILLPLLLITKTKQKQALLPFDDANY